MTQNEMRDLIRNSMEKPFRIYLDDGRSFRVAHPDFAMAGRDAVVLASGPGHEFGGSYVICYFDHISSIELLHRPRSKTGK